MYICECTDLLMGFKSYIERNEDGYFTPTYDKNKAFQFDMLEDAANVAKEYQHPMLQWEVKEVF